MVCYLAGALSQPSVEAMGSSPLKLLSREAIVTDGQSDAPGTSARHHIDKTTITREDQLQVIEDEEVCDEVCFCELFIGQSRRKQNMKLKLSNLN